jgi:glycosyltransferase involved in cell wall biosynthesis
MNPKDLCISVIITSYNQKSYLIEAIESVINQTVKPHEIIIVDDRSTDDKSIEIIREYVARYPTLIKAIFQEKNVGIPKNRNTALHKVTGNYVAILDGDDRFLPDKVETELAALRQHPAVQCIYSNVRYIDAGGQVLGVRDQEEQPSGDTFVHVARGKFGLLRSMLIDYLFLREVGFLDERLPSYDGFELTVRLAKQGRFAYVAESLVECRIHSVSYQTKITAKDHLHDLRAIYEKILPWLAGLAFTERRKVVKAWQEWFLRFRLRETAEQRNRLKSYLTIFLAIASNRVRWEELRQITVAEVPGLWPFS